MVEYRDMVVIVRDRIKALIEAGATLQQVKAARVTADYDTQSARTRGHGQPTCSSGGYTSLKAAPAKR